MEPMLATDYQSRKARLKFPVALQPKLDGVRCIASLDPTGAVRLVTRLGNDLAHLERVRREVAPVLTTLGLTGGNGVALDGELYVHGSDFQHVVSRVKNRKAADDGTLRFHAFDICTPQMGFGARYAELERAVKGTRVVLVPCVSASSEKEIDAALARFEKEGYEGVMVRDPAALYAPGKRSPGLCKYKRFLTEEFEIVGFKEAAGKDAGTAVFECACKAGTFWVRPEGDRASRAKLLADAPRLIGKPLTVRFQELTLDGKPRFPIGVAVRDYE